MQIGGKSSFDLELLLYNVRSLRWSLVQSLCIFQHKLPGRSEISWKPDFSVVALGNEDG